MNVSRQECLLHLFKYSDDILFGPEARWDGTPGPLISWGVTVVDTRERLRRGDVEITAETIQGKKTVVATLRDPFQGRHHHFEHTKKRPSVEPGLPVCHLPCSSRAVTLPSRFNRASLIASCAWIRALSISISTLSDFSRVVSLLLKPRKRALFPRRYPSAACPISWTAEHLPRAC